MDLVVRLAQSSHRRAGLISGVAARREPPEEAGRSMSGFFENGCDMLASGKRQLGRLWYGRVEEECSEKEDCNEDSRV
jgi:hypothetical protein